MKLIDLSKDIKEDNDVSTEHPDIVNKPMKCAE